MRVEILDYDSFNAIEPVRVEKYLENNGWQKRRTLPTDVSIWDQPDRHSNRNFRLWLPEAIDLADFPQAMAKLVKTLAQAENRSELQVLEDLNTAAVGDIIRLRTHDPLNRESGTLPFYDGLALIEQARDLATAAAMSEQGPREVHPTSRTRPVLDFVHNMRLGQTEYGSYTIKLISPIEVPDTEIAPQQELPMLGVEEEPFSRRVVRRLARGLGILHDIAGEASQRGKYYFQPFLESVPQGVSADLCDALVNRRRTEVYKPIQVTITWSYMLAQLEQERGIDLEFPLEHMQYFVQASEDFRRRNPEQRIVNGYVKVLSRDRGENTGTITIMSIVNNRPRAVRMELTGRAYALAIRAHEEELFASVQGDLLQRGRFLWLDNPSDFQIVENPQLEFDS